MKTGLSPISPPDDCSRLWAEFPRDWRRGDVPESYRLFWRQHDGYGQILPRPEPSQVAKFYDVDDYYTHERGRSGAKATMSFANRVLFHLAWRLDHGVDATLDWWSAMLEPGTKSVLDIGCGNGDRLRVLSDLGHVCTGVEPDQRARQEARRNHLNVLLGIAEDLPDAVLKQKYDFVLMFHVLEHCIDPERAIRDARNLLKDDGKLIVEVPNNNCVGRDFHGSGWLWLDVPRHLNFFTRTSLKKLLEGFAFQSLVFEHHGYTRQFSEDWFSQQDRICRAFERDRTSGTLSRLRYLVKSGFSPDDKKYDSIRVVASQRAQPS